jgi:hypothetical protein
MVDHDSDHSRSHGRVEAGVVVGRRCRVAVGFVERMARSEEANAQ